MNGWISLDRNVIDHPLFKSEPARLGGWVWMITKAAWKSTRHDIAGRIVTIERGQICISQRTLSSELGWTLRSTQRFLQRLESLAMIRLETASGRSIITICNYDKYQSGSNEAASEARQERVTKEQGNKRTIYNKHLTTDSRARDSENDQIENRQDQTDPPPAKPPAKAKPAQEPASQPAPSPKFTSFLRATKMVAVPMDLPKMMDKWLNSGLDWDEDILPIIQKTADDFRRDKGQTARKASFFDDAISQRLQEDHDFFANLERIKTERLQSEKDQRDRQIIQAAKDIHYARDWLLYPEETRGRPPTPILREREAEGIEALKRLNLDPEKIYARWAAKQPKWPPESVAA